MKEIIQFLNSNSGALNVAFSAVVTIATVVYAVLTSILVVETRRTRAAQTEPKLDISIQPRDEWINFVDLCIRNVGAGPAHDVQFTITPLTQNPATTALVEGLHAFNLMKYGCGYFGQRREFRSFFTSLVEDFEGKVASRIQVKISYRGTLGTRYADTYVLDFSEMVGLHQLGKPPLYEIAHNLESIRADLNRAVTGFQRLKVDAYMHSDRRREEMALEEDRQRFAAEAAQARTPEHQP